VEQAEQLLFFNRSLPLFHAGVWTGGFGWQEHVLRDGYLPQAFPFSVVVQFQSCVPDRAPEIHGRLLFGRERPVAREHSPNSLLEDIFGICFIFQYRCGEPQPPAGVVIDDRSQDRSQVSGDSRFFSVRISS
jgi:hypothetical protein